MAVLWDRRDPEAGTQTLEMENQGFWAASDEVSGFHGDEWSMGWFLRTAAWELCRSLHWVSVAQADRSCMIPGSGGGLGFLSPLCGCWKGMGILLRVLKLTAASPLCAFRSLRRLTSAGKGNLWPVERTCSCWG